MNNLPNEIERLLKKNWKILPYIGSAAGGGAGGRPPPDFGETFSIQSPPYFGWFCSQLFNFVYNMIKKNIT